MPSESQTDYSHIPTVVQLENGGLLKELKCVKLRSSLPLDLPSFVCLFGYMLICIYFLLFFFFWGGDKPQTAVPHPTPTLFLLNSGQKIHLQSVLDRYPRRESWL